MRKIALILLTLNLSLFAHAGNDQGNGGSPEALEFHDCAKRAVQIYRQFLLKNKETKSLNFEKLLAEVKVLTTKSSLFSELDGEVQNSTAINFPNTKTILVNEKRWRAIRETAVREALALHEILSLLGVEKTGDYHISRGYLEVAGVRCDKGICDTSGTERTDSKVILCRINNRKYPDDLGRFDFNCVSTHQSFSILCDLRTDPLENGGFNKLDIRGGRWIKQVNGEFLEFDDGFTSGIMKCDKQGGF